MFYLYLITAPSGKSYIGKTNNPRHRLRGHWHAKVNTPLSNAFSKYGRMKKRVAENPEEMRKRALAMQAAVRGKKQSPEQIAARMASQKATVARTRAEGGFAYPPEVRAMRAARMKRIRSAQREAGVLISDQMRML